ncbi:MAG TPA: DUF2254 domain-containing protein [Azospirillaceae bacterium]|nr:DUF2254 domain-containing protein [Azospirillaceae bacterium]
MSDRLRNLWESLRTSLWPLPMIMGLAAVALASLMLRVPSATTGEGGLRGWLLAGGTGEDAQNLLTALTTALISMAGVVFSITMVVLSLAANQFGPRLVRTYTSDVRAQLAIGIFVLTAVYCLIVLRSIEKGMSPADVPQPAVALGVALALLCIMVVVLFLGLIARLIVAETVIARVAGELEAFIATLPPAGEAADEPDEAAMAPDDLLERSALVRSDQEGYVQSIEYRDLAAAAREAGALVRFDYRAGAFMCREGWLALVHPAEALTPELEAAVRRAVAIGRQRTPTQDLEFPIRHLVDIALRALSPGINDPNTATAVIDRLRGALARLMAKQLPVAVMRDADGTMRVLGDSTGFDGILDAAFHQIRQAGGGQPAVVIHLLGAIARLAEHVRTPQQRRALQRHADMIAAAGLRAVQEPNDRADIEKAADALRHKLRSLIRLHPADRIPAAAD